MRILVIASAYAMLAVVPPFLIGALASDVREDLGLGPALLGLVLTLYFLGTALSALSLGPLVEGTRGRWGIALGAALTGLALLAIASAQSWAGLAMGLTLGGVANGLSTPAINATIASRVQFQRLGLAIGLKQSAVPAVTLLVGLAVPTVANGIGWRGTTLIVATIAIMMAVAANSRLGRGLSNSVTAVIRTGITEGARSPRREASPESAATDTPVVDPSLRLAAMGGALGAAAAVGLGTLGVDAAVTSGASPTTAGAIIAVASVIGLSCRLGMGWIADARPTLSRHGLVSGLLLVGCSGFLMLASSASYWQLAGFAVAFGAGWGWPGLMHLIAVTHDSQRPAASTGVVQGGLALGAALGPVGLGALAQSRSYDLAWITASGMCLVSSMLLLRAGTQRKAELPQ